MDSGLLSCNRLKPATLEQSCDIVCKACCKVLPLEPASMPSTL